MIKFKPKPKTLAEAWQAYDTRVLNGEHSVERLRDFFAGAAATLGILFRSVEDAPPALEEQAQALDQEIRRFADELVVLAMLTEGGNDVEN
jgi:hypothetical protein